MGGLRLGVAVCFSFLLAACGGGGGGGGGAPSTATVAYDDNDCDFGCTQHSCRARCPAGEIARWPCGCPANEKRDSNDQCVCKTGYRPATVGDIASLSLSDGSDYAGQLMQLSDRRN